MILDPPRSLTKRDRRYSSLAWRRVREQVRLRDDRTCQACGRREPQRGRTFPVDHKYPGADFYDPDGLWLLCWSCNTSKSGQDVDTWYARSQRGATVAAPQRAPNPYAHHPAPISSPRILVPVIDPPMPAYHLHRWGPQPWQVMGFGDMGRGWPMNESCPPDCHGYRREGVGQ